MRRRLLLPLLVALVAALAWPAQGFAATGAAAVVVESSASPIAGTQFQIDFTLSRGRYFGDSSPDLSFELSKVSTGPTQTAAEIHVLQFALPPWALSTGPDGRSGQVHAGAWLGRWGSMDMSLKTTGAGSAARKDVGSCTAVPARVLKGTLNGRLVLRLPGVGNLRAASIPVTVTVYPRLPSGCLSQSGPSCTRGNASTGDGGQLIGDLTLDTVFAGPQQSAPEVTEFYLDATSASAGSSGTPLNVAVLGFLDSPQQTQPATVIHYLLLDMASPALSVDAATRNAAVKVSGSLASGTLGFVPTQGVAPQPCGDTTLVAGRVTGSLSVNFSWGGTRQYNGDTAATLTLGPSLPAAPPGAAPTLAPAPELRRP